MARNYNNFPRQQLPDSKKTKSWRKQCVDWADNNASLGSSLVRKTVYNKKINYDLVNGKIHMRDLERVLNPTDLSAGFIPEKIPHYPIINSKLNVLKGEESKRVFDFKVVVTNPNAISEIENNKKEQMFAELQQLIANSAMSEEEFNQELEKLSDYYTYEWQDLKEIRANTVLNHYSKEYDFPAIFNSGFMDAMIVGEEIYQCDIVGGEPTLERINPLKIRVFKSGYSNKIEDADVIIMEDYWSPGKIIDTYYEQLSSKDIKYLEELPSTIGSADVDSMGNYDERKGFVQVHMMSDVFEDSDVTAEDLFAEAEHDSLMPYDTEGNVRVIKIFWKSRRKVKKVKHYDPVTGEVMYDIYPDDYKIKEELGEEETSLWINQAWEGVKIGEDIYINMRPRPIQYNRLSNPSRCHFGIIGSIYNLNDDRPFSLVDMMKEYNYLYDVMHDRLNKMIARNWGKIITLDLAKVPVDWDVEKWMYYATMNGLAVVDSFREGNYGAATGKIAGGLNNNTSGVIDAEIGNSIQALLSMLEYIKTEMSEVSGISKQREGQISNRETVGGVERATLQSSHITEWLFITHDNLKKRVLECFLETAKQAFKGNELKFQHILSDMSTKIMNIDGDEFSEADYGLVVENSNNLQKLQSQMETLAQAALQNQALSFSTIMKIYNSTSVAEKQRMIETDERKMQERAQQAQQQQLQQQQQIAQMQEQTKLQQMQHEDMLNQRDNETKILIAEINAAAKQAGIPEDGVQEAMSEEAKQKLAEQIREFDARLSLDKERLAFDKQKANTDARLKEKQINKKPSTK